MAYPDLTRGLCIICYGSLSDETRDESCSGVHKGVCALLAGVGFTDEQQEFSYDLIADAHSEAPNSPARREATERYYRYIRGIATEDHYDTGGPS